MAIKQVQQLHIFEWQRMQNRKKRKRIHQQSQYIYGTLSVFGYCMFFWLHFGFATRQKIGHIKYYWMVNIFMWTKRIPIIICGGKQNSLIFIESFKQKVPELSTKYEIGVWKLVSGKKNVVYHWRWRTDRIPLANLDFTLFDESDIV